MGSPQLYPSESIVKCIVYFRFGLSRSQYPMLLSVHVIPSMTTSAYVTLFSLNFC